MRPEAELSLTEQQIARQEADAWIARIKAGKESVESAVREYSSNRPFSNLVRQYIREGVSPTPST